MFVLTGNVRQTRDSRAPSPVLRDDGTNYPFRMFFDGNARIVDADSLAELIEQLIPGYLELDDDGRRDARLRAARGAAFNARASVLGGLSEDELAGLSEWEFQVLSSDEPLEEIYPLYRLSDPGDAMSPFWGSEIPLVLVEEDYVPFTSLIAPMSSFGDSRNVSNILWFRSSTEEGFLDSLAQVGVLVYGSPRVEPGNAMR